MMKSETTGTSGETPRRHSGRQGLKPVRDAVIAFAVFSVIAMTAGSGQIFAGPTTSAHVILHNQGLNSQAIPALAKDGPAPVVQIATVAANDEDDAAYRRTSFSAAWVLLAASFSLIAALNLAVARHLRQAYVPRRRPSSKA